MRTDDIINPAIDRLSYLLGGEDFHGFRSEVWNVFTGVIAETILRAKNMEPPAIPQQPQGEICPKCNGSGSILTQPIKSNGISVPALGNVPCFTCSGTGKLSPVR